MAPDKTQTDNRGGQPTFLWGSAKGQIPTGVGHGPPASWIRPCTMYNVHGPAWIGHWRPITSAVPFAKQDQPVSNKQTFLNV